MDYLKLIKKDKPEWELVNQAKNGETFNVIAGRLLELLQKDHSFDAIVLEGGSNDILLPHFKERRGLFGFAYNIQINKGFYPLTSEKEFDSKLRETISQIKEKHGGILILTTIGCISENLQDILNEKRKSYNKRIRQVAKDENIFLADCALEYEKILGQITPNKYCLDSFISASFLDRIISQFKNEPAFLSRKRNLTLTIDGVHLNMDGALIYKKNISKKLKSIK